MFFVLIVLSLISLVIHTTTGTFVVDHQFVQNFLNASSSYWAQHQNPQFQLADFMDDDIRSCTPQADWTCLKGKNQVMDDIDKRRKLINHAEERVFNLNVYSKGFSGDIELFDIRWGQNCMVTSMTGSFMVRVNDIGKVIEHYFWLDDADMYHNFWSAAQKRECLRQDFIPRTPASFTKLFCQNWEDFLNDKISEDTILTIMSSEAIVCTQGDCIRGHEKIRMDMPRWRNMVRSGGNKIDCEIMYASGTPVKALTIRWSWLFTLFGGDDFLTMGISSLVFDSEGKVLIELDNSSEQSFNHLSLYLGRNVQQESSSVKKEM